MAEDAGGETDGDGGTERGEVRKEAGEMNGRTKDSEEARGATDEATRNHDGKSIQGRAGKAGGGDRPARSGTRPAGRSTRSGSRIVGAIAAEEVSRGADASGHEGQHGRKKHEHRAVRPRGSVGDGK